MGLECRSSTELGKERLHSWRLHTRFHVHRDPGQSHDSTGAWVDLRVRGRSRKGLLRRQGGWLLLTVRAGTLVVEIPENIHWHELSRKRLFWLPF